MMASRIAGVASDDRAKTIEPATAAGIVSAGRTPTSRPAMAAAAATPKAQPNGSAMTTATVRISQFGMRTGASRPRYCAASHATCVGGGSAPAF